VEDVARALGAVAEKGARKLRDDAVKMISETPMPTPYSVMSSPSHMAMIVPAVRVMMIVSVSVTLGLTRIATCGW